MRGITNKQFTQYVSSSTIRCEILNCRVNRRTLTGVFEKVNLHKDDIVIENFDEYMTHHTTQDRYS